MRDRISSFLELDDVAMGEDTDGRLIAAVDALKSELGLTLVERRKITAQLTELENGKWRQLEAQAEAAIELGKDELARAALMKKAELQGHRAALGARLAELTSAARELEVAARALQDPSGDNTLEARLAELETLLKDAQITDYTAASGDR